MKPAVILSLAIACMAAPMAPGAAYKDALDIITKQGAKFSDSALRKRHGQEPDAFNIIFKDGVSIDQIYDHLKQLDGLIDSDSLNGIKSPFDMPSQKDGSGLMGYTGNFDDKIVEALGEQFSDLITVEKDRVLELPTFQDFKETSEVFEEATSSVASFHQDIIGDFMNWWGKFKKGGNPFEDFGRFPRPPRFGRPPARAPAPAPAPVPEAPESPEAPEYPEAPAPPSGSFPPEAPIGTEDPIGAFPTDAPVSPNVTFPAANATLPINGTVPLPLNGTDDTPLPTGTIPEPSFAPTFVPESSVAPSAVPSAEPSAEPSGPATFSEIPGKNWGLYRVSHKENNREQDQYAINKDAKNPTVAYIMDTGIRISHKMFEGRAVWGANFADNIDRDTQGHGTHVAGTVGGAEYGVSPSTKLVAVKVFAGKYGSSSTIMKGLSWAIDDFVKNKAQYPRAVINFSGGGDTSEAEDALFKKAVAMGMVVAVAAGNDNRDACYVSPARAGASTPGYITVGASSPDDSFAVWDARQASNWGTCVDVVAPGTEILSASFQSDTGILSNTGTSMATPHVAGMAAQLMATSSELLTPSQVEDMLINGNNGKLSGNLKGTPNKLAYNGSGL